MLDFITAINNCPSELSYLRDYICMYYQAWIDNDENIYVQQEFCQYGDLLDYLEQIEHTKCIEMNVDFYWNLIFELLCVSIHI